MSGNILVFLQSLNATKPNKTGTNVGSVYLKHEFKLVWMNKKPEKMEATVLEYWLKVETFVFIQFSRYPLLFSLVMNAVFVKLRVWFSTVIIKSEFHPAHMLHACNTYVSKAWVKNSKTSDSGLMWTVHKKSCDSFSAVADRQQIPLVWFESPCLVRVESYHIVIVGNLY